MKTIFPACALVALWPISACGGEMLERFLESTEAIDFIFMNSSGNSSELLAGINVNISGVSEPTSGANTVADVVVPRSQSVYPLESTVTDLTTSVTGVLQVGNLDVFSDLDVPYQGGSSRRLSDIIESREYSQGMAVQNSINPQALHNYFLINSGSNLGDIDGSVSIRSHSDNSAVSDLSSSAVGASASGNISILISRE